MAHTREYTIFCNLSALFNVWIYAESFRKIIHICKAQMLQCTKEILLVCLPIKTTLLLASYWLIYYVTIFLVTQEMRGTQLWLTLRRIAVCLRKRSWSCLLKSVLVYLF